MSTKKHINYAAPYQRRTLALRGTVSRVEAQLDHSSQLAVAYARDWLNTGPAQMGVDVRASGVIRRSLDLYMRHLSSPTVDPEQEARAVRLCCSSSPVDAEERQAAWDRLECVDDEELPLLAWSDVLHGPDSASRTAAINASADELFNEIAATP